MNNFQKEFFMNSDKNNKFKINLNFIKNILIINIEDQNENSNIENKKYYESQFDFEFFSQNKFFKFDKFEETIEEFYYQIEKQNKNLIEESNYLNFILELPSKINNQIVLKINEIKKEENNNYLINALKLENEKLKKEINEMKQQKNNNTNIKNLDKNIYNIFFEEINKLKNEIYFLKQENKEIKNNIYYIINKYNINYDEINTYIEQQKIINFINESIFWKTFFSSETSDYYNLFTENDLKKLFLKFPPLKDDIEVEIKKIDSEISFYYGEVKKGTEEKHGRGFYIHKEHHYFFKGQFNIALEGKGIQIYESGNYYEGDIKNWMRHGKGIFYYYKLGDIYIGDWRYNNQNGYGIEYFSNGNKYEGEWKNDLADGIGIFTWKNGSKYEGTMVKNKIKGKGILKSYFGDIYEGDWDDGNQNGKGRYIFKNGNIYEGEWKNNKKNGVMKFYDKKNNKWIEELWENGVKKEKNK